MSIKLALTWIAWNHADLAHSMLTSSPSVVLYLPFRLLAKTRCTIFSSYQLPSKHSRPGSACVGLLGILSNDIPDKTYHSKVFGSENSSLVR